MATTTHVELDEVVRRARQAARGAGEIPGSGLSAAPVALAERVELGGWLSEMVRSGQWADMMAEITAEDPELASDLPPG